MESMGGFACWTLALMLIRRPSERLDGVSQAHFDCRTAGNASASRTPQWGYASEDGKRFFIRAAYKDSTWNLTRAHALLLQCLPRGNASGGANWETAL